MYKMAAISHTIFSDAFSTISQKFVPKGPIGNNPVFV